MKTNQKKSRFCCGETGTKSNDDVQDSGVVLIGLCEEEAANRGGENAVPTGSMLGGASEGEWILGWEAFFFGALKRLKPWEHSPRLPTLGPTGKRTIVGVDGLGWLGSQSNG